MRLQLRKRLACLVHGRTMAVIRECPVWSSYLKISVIWMGQLTDVPATVMDSPKFCRTKSSTRTTIAPRTASVCALLTGTLLLAWSTEMSVVCFCLEIDSIYSITDGEYQIAEIRLISPMEAPQNRLPIPHATWLAQEIRHIFAVPVISSACTDGPVHRCIHGIRLQVLVQVHISY